MQTTVVNPAALSAEDAEQIRRRQELLAAYGLLDGQAEPDLDDLVELAATLCETPIAAVNLLGEHQQLFKAERGLGVTEIPLALSFCRHLHAASEARQFEDLSQDARFADNPLVTDPAGLRFYAGAPLRTTDGVFLGTLCVFDWQPRELSTARLQGLDLLARQVLRLFESRLPASTPARHNTLDEAHYRALMDVNPQIIWFARPDGTFEYANRYWYEYSGLTPARAAADPELWAATIHPDQRQLLLRRWGEVREQRVAGSLELQLRDAQGRYRWFETRTMPFTNASGEIEHWVGVAQDIDSRKRAETALQESEAFAHLLLESTHEGFCALDREGRTTLCNRAFRQMLGLAEDRDGLGEPLDTRLGSARSEDGAQAILRAARDGAILHLSADALLREDGSLLPVEWRAQPLWRDGEVQGAICTFVDLSERIRSHDRQRFLLELGDLLHGVTHTGDVAPVLGDSLGHLLAVQRIGYARVGRDGSLTIDSDWLDQGRTRRLNLPSLAHWHTPAVAELRRGVIVSVEDSARDSRLGQMRERLLEHDVRAGLVVPLLADEELVGLLFLYTDTPRHWTVGDVALVREVAERIRIVIERTAAADALRVAEQRIALAMDVADLGVWDYDIDRDLISWDARLAHLVGAPERRRQTRGAALLRALHPADAPRVRAYVTAAIQSQGSAYDLRLTFRVRSSRQEEPVWLSIRGRERQEPGGRRRLVGIARDITRERHDADRISETNRQLRQQIEERREAAARQHALIELGDRLREGDPESAGVAAALELVGVRLGLRRVGYARLDESRGTFVPQQVWTPNGSCDHALAYPLLAPDSLGTQEGEAPLVIDDVSQDPRAQTNAQRLLDLEIAALVDIPLYEDGRLRALFVAHDQRARLWQESEVQFLRDVTDRLWSAICRQRSQDAQRESEGRFRLMADSAPVLIWACDADGQLQFVNQRFASEFDLHDADLHDLGWSALLPETEGPAFEGAFQQAIATHSALRAEVRVRNAQGEWRWLRLEGTPRLEVDGEFHGLVGCGVDITEARQTTDQLEQRIAERTQELGHSHARLIAEIYERERTEEALRQSQKMEAIGQLTGGIAHDFNNMLTGIVGALDLIRLRIANGRTQDLDRYINAAVNSADRAAALTHRLLAFARRQTLDPQPVDVHQLIESLQDLLVRTVGENVALRLDLAPVAWLAHSDAHQLENALLNLVINGRDAMPAGGELCIATANLSLDAEAAARESLTPGDYVRLSVTDTGTGMPPEVKAKAFEPFFTTKPAGQGTGLGLSMIYGFVKQSGGTARIDTEQGQGTTISLYLPRHAEVAAPTPDQPATKVAPRAEAGQTVLVVEDEYAVRMIVLEVLAELGYTALEASDADGALPIIESGQRLDLLISDVGLPGMNGRQLAEIARGRRPELKVLFITGYAKNAKVRGEFLGENMDMLIKPFDIDALAERIHSMIQG